MDTLQAILLGIVQGITEFLPVSSSGHLQIAKELLGVELEENLTFDVVLHAATVLSTIVVLRSEVWRLLGGALLAPVQRRAGLRAQTRRVDDSDRYRRLAPQRPAQCPARSPLYPRRRRRDAPPHGRAARLRLLRQAAAEGDDLLPRRLRHRPRAGLRRHAGPFALGIDHRHGPVAGQQKRRPWRSSRSSWCWPRFWARRCSKPRAAN